MTFGITFFSLCILFIVWQIYRIKNKKTEDEIIQERTEDELLFDPYTGKQITLEEAESGNWTIEEHEKQEKLEKYLDKFSSTEEKEEVLVNQYITMSESYEISELTEEQLALLEEFAIFSEESSWSYSDSYIYNKKHLFILVNFHSSISSQIVAIVKTEDIKGHYYLREKSSIEKIFDSIRSDDELFLENYESYTFEQSGSKLIINKILDKIKGQKDLEIEIYNNALLLKTLKNKNIADLKRLEEIANNVCLITKTLY